MNRSEKKRARREARLASRVKRKREERRLQRKQTYEALHPEARPLPQCILNAPLDVALAAMDPLNNCHGHLGHHYEPVVLLERPQPRSPVPGSIEEAIEQLDPGGVLRAAYRPKKEG